MGHPPYSVFAARGLCIRARLAVPWSFYIFNEGRYMKICGILGFFGHSERFALYQGTTLVGP